MQQLRPFVFAVCFLLFFTSVVVAQEAFDASASIDASADIDIITGEPLNGEPLPEAQAIPQELGEGAAAASPDLPHRFAASSSAVTSSVIERARNDAAAGSPDAHYLLGLAYFYGDGVEESKHRALSFFKEAARLGHAQAHVNLGHMLEHGISTSADPNAAYAYYRQASIKWQEVEASYRASVLLYSGKVSTRVATWEQGMNAAKEMLDLAVAADHPKAYFYLGSLYEYGGADLPANFTEAVRLYSIGCEKHEDVEACYNLALMHAFGRGTVQDWSASAGLFQQAADRRQHGPSSYFLGIQFTNGQGVPTDYRLGEKYLQQALDSGDERVKDKAVRALEDLRRANSFAESLNDAELRELELRMKKETPDEAAAGGRSIPVDDGRGSNGEPAKTAERIREEQEMRYASLQGDYGEPTLTSPNGAGGTTGNVNGPGRTLNDEEVEAILARLAIPEDAAA